MKTTRSLASRVVSIGFVLLVASAASAFQMSGQFGSSRGGTIDIPAIGNTPNNCDHIQIGQRTAQEAVPPVATPAVTRITQAQPFGCIQGGPASVPTTGAGVGASFTIPSGFFSIPAPGTTVAVSVPIAAQVVQLATSFQIGGPLVPQTTGPMGTLYKASQPTNPSPAVPHVFRQGAWSTQTGRAAPTFTWCPGAGPACNDIDDAPPGTELIVKYTGGDRLFGGTMALVINSGPNLSSLAVNAAPGLPAGAIGFAILAGMGSQPTGRGYANLSTDELLSGPVWLMYMVGMVPNTKVGKDFTLITSVMTFFGNQFPTATNFNYGFPFTTGRVVARNTGTALGNVVQNTLTDTGDDTVTPLGARNISLVSGAIAHTSLGTNNPTIGSMPEPGSAAQLLAAVLGLAAVGAWRSRQSR